MNITKYNCVICHIPFDDSIHLPRVLNLCGHIVCSLCISKKLLSNKNNTFSCPKDNTIYSKIESIDYFRINKGILDKIKDSTKETIDNNYMNDSSKFDNILSEKISVQTQKTTKTKLDTITINDNSIINNTALSLVNSNPNGNQCYIKKIIKFGKELKFTKNSSICSIHSLPLNIICVNDQQKICSQCALNNAHLNHQIIPENKFIEYIDELVKVYQEIENNLKIYGEINNTNSFSLLEKIEIKINTFKKNITKICDDLIDNINSQSKQIIKYLELRKNELFKKYQSTNYDINNLRDSTRNWIDITCNKLTQASSGNANELDIEILKLLDNDENKNIFNLINSGKQLNERYNFINETKIIFDKLKEFNLKGINLEPNYKIIDSIMTNSNINEGIKETKIYSNYNYNESIINTKGNNISTLGNNNIINKSINFNTNNKNSNIFETSLFKLEENKDIIDFLHLTPISILYKQTKNIFITYEDEDFNFNSEPYNTITNNSNVFSPRFKLHSNNINRNVYSKKTINQNHNSDSYKTEYFLSFRNDNMSKTQNNFYDLSNKINLINLKENQKAKYNRLSLSGNIRHKMKYDIRDSKALYQNFKKILYPKLEKVKTCDVVFLGSKNRKRKNSFNLSDIEDKKYKQERTVIKLPMSPQLKSVYNLINNNMKIKDITLPLQEINNQTNKSKMNSEKKTKDKKSAKSYKVKNIETKYKTKYFRCVSCSGTLNKKDIQDISILFNLKEKDAFSPGRNKKSKNLFKNKSNKIKNKENEKDSDISELTSNNVSNYSHNLNRSCTKHNSKTYYNYRNKNGSQTKVINTSFINKDLNELQKIISTQMKKPNPVFNRINMRDQGIQLLCDYMHKNKNKKYKEMKLPGCNLNDNDFCKLVKSLIENEIEMPVLNLSYNKISDNSAKYIFEIITKKSCLKNIYLYNNFFSRSFIDKIKNYNSNKEGDCIKLFT